MCTDELARVPLSIAPLQPAELESVRSAIRSRLATDLADGMMRACRDDRIGLSNVFADELLSLVRQRIRFLDPEQMFVGALEKAFPGADLPPRDWRVSHGLPGASFAIAAAIERIPPMNVRMASTAGSCLNRNGEAHPATLCWQDDRYVERELARKRLNAMRALVRGPVRSYLEHLFEENAPRFLLQRDPRSD